MKWYKEPDNDNVILSVPGCGTHCRCKRSGCRMNNPWFCVVKVNNKPCKSLTCFVQAGS